MLHFQHFKEDFSGISIPEKFTFPFYYEPHALTKIAVNEVQEYLKIQTDFKHDFGLPGQENSYSIGKMFGVLIVRKKDNTIGYLAAFSGKLFNNSLPAKFVPPIFNMRTEGSFYTKKEREIELIGEKIEILKKDKAYLSLKESVKKLTKTIEDDLATQRKKMKVSKLDRKLRKKEALNLFDTENFEIFSRKLTQESYNDQFFFKELQEYYKNKIEKSKHQLVSFENKITTLIKIRKKTSANLQNTLFEKYQFLNHKKEQKGLKDIFNNPTNKPPAGSGDCSAPKLLQYAFQNNLTPIAMAEFWWGVSPNSEIRKHKNFYPACQSRCKPILKHMLKGIKMDSNLLIDNIKVKRKLKIIYEDETIIVVNKPPELLSVPGKKIVDSVYTRIKKLYPSVTGPLIVHRLDMSTSGILLLSKTKESNKILQSQFIKRTIKKRYVALLDGNLMKSKGKIQLPLRLDIDDRPRQLVDFKNGKNAETHWEIIEKKDSITRVHFYPITGRTHQLRVHAAHKDGLNAPIIGDDLYGKKNTRLLLHAEFIEFYHPTSKELINFTVEAEF